MAEKTTEQKVIDIIAEVLLIEADTIKPESSLVNDLSADSIDIVEMTMAVEEEFGIEIPDDTAQKLDTVAKVVEYVNEQTKP
jgi:acyl carrier protein